MDNDKKRGTKRKRYEPPQEELSVRIKGKLHHEMKEVHKASKRAKTFETQKVVKKLKDLGKKGDDSQDIEKYETELTYLKGADHDSIGNTAFKTKLLKDRTLRENEDVMTAVNTELEGSLVVLAEPGTAGAKIQSRLLSSKFLSTQIATSLEALKVLLNPALKQDNVHTPSNKGKERPEKRRKEMSKSTLQAINSTAKAPSKPDDASQDSSIDMEGWESGSIDGAEADDGWESGDLGSESEEDADNQKSEGEGEDSEPRVNSNSKPTHPSKPVKSLSSKNESTFLPSLSVGFIRGGSSDESDWSEKEGKGTDLEPKKNRRGQRARRAIWEKKFGRNANHKKKEEEISLQARKISGHTSKITGSNNKGPSADRRPAHYSKDKSLSQVHHPVDAGWGTRTRTVGASIPAIAAATGGADRPLHPSWEAKRNLREKQSVGIVASQGKKIKFS